MASFKPAVEKASRALAYDASFSLLTGDCQEEVEKLRAEADFTALKHRFHSPQIHHQFSPAQHDARHAFDALENARIDIAGSTDLLGVQHNLDIWLSQQRNNANPENNALGNVLGLLIKTQAGARLVPETLKQDVSEWQKILAEKTPGLLQKMAAARYDQEQYARLSLELLNGIGVIEKQGQEQTAPPHESEDTPTDASPPLGNQAEEKKPLLKEGSESVNGTSALSGTTHMDAQASADNLLDDRKEPQIQSMAGPASNNALGIQEYSVFTHEYDEIVPAANLASAQELEVLYRQLEQKLLPFQAVAARIAGKLQHILLARQDRKWIYDMEEGLLDSRRLNRIVLRPGEANYFKQQEQSDFKDTVISLLIDNSGSMRGRPITIAALSASILGKALERSGVMVEVLGFTTRDWKGGESARKWRLAGKPSHPGRLNDLRHIIYKSAEQPWRRAQKSLGLMLKDGILKENIDAEAILWACKRLLKRTEQRRILMVISDGAPVDDSTLSANNGVYLDQHLRATIRHVENNLPIELLAIGIGHDVTRYYTRAVTLESAEKLPEIMARELIDLFKNAQKSRKVMPL